MQSTNHVVPFVEMKTWNETATRRKRSLREYASLSPKGAAQSLGRPGGTGAPPIMPDGGLPCYETTLAPYPPTRRRPVAKRSIE